MLDMLLATGVILLVLLGWIGVQQGARGFARRHPELGPAREEGSGCGAGCHCGAGQCRRNTNTERYQGDDEHDPAK